MEIKELENMSSAELFALSDKYRQAAIEKRILELLEAKIPEMEKTIEEAHTRYCLSQLTDEKARNLKLQEREACLASDMESLRRQLDACQEERRRVEAGAERQARELKRLQEAAERDNRQQQGYRQACEEKTAICFPLFGQKPMRHM